jgi:MFS transporter, DHA1 family, tetracycline resistance protein
MKKPSLFVVFLTVFIDLIGFGIVLPLLPLYSKLFGANGFVIGAIIASYSAMQFLFAPMWGRLSDRIGRRPVLLVSTAGAVVSYALFGMGSSFSGATALGVLLISRIFAGICGANITVAQAYIADISPPEKRSQRMGLIGMAFGLGFIFGPALGGITYKAFGITGPGYVAASLCALNFVLAYFILPESRKPGSDHVAPRPRLAQWAHTMGHPQIGLLVTVFFLSTFAFTCFETTLGLLVGRNFHLDIVKDDHAKTTVSYLFAYCGVIGAFIQGGAIGRAVKKMGEPRLITFSLLLVAISLALMPFVHGTEAFSWRNLFAHAGTSWLQLFLVLALLSIGSSLTRPPVFGLISILTPAHEQGAVIGIAQSAGSLARILGPIFAATLFDYSSALPYLVCSGICVIAGMVTWQRLCRADQLPLTAPLQKPS